MKTLDEIMATLRAQKPFLFHEYGVREIGVFGSYVRSEQKPDSDLDILIEFERPTHIGLENYLSDLLGVKVDLFIRKNLKRRIGQHILQEVITL